MSVKRGRDNFQKYKKILCFLSKLIKIFPCKIRKKIFMMLRNKKGLSGIALRYIILKSIAKKVGDNVSIHENVYLFSPENLQIGDNVSIHPMCYIDATGGINIGDDVSIAHMVTIMSTTHLFENVDIPIKNQGCVSKCTSIGNNVWIGAKSTILYGVEISEGCVIGANSLVNKSIEEFSVACGNPAKIIKERK